MRAAARAAFAAIAARLPADRRKPALQRIRRATRPALLGTLRRTRPLSERWGSDRGTPVDRYYIDRFLEEFRDDIRGRVLEIKDTTYTDRFGAGVTEREVLDLDAANPRATVIADLASAASVESSSFDCFVLTQTLQLIPEPGAAIAHSHRILRPGGVLLVTVPVLSRLVGTAADDVDYWRFTPASCRHLFGKAFGSDAVTVRAYGNVLSSIAFLTGMAHEELRRAELNEVDDRFPLVVAVRAVKR